MEDNQQANPNQQPSDSNAPSASTEGKNAQSEEDAKSKTKSCDTPKNEPCNIVVKVENVQKEKWTIANYIALASVVVGAFLFYFTYKLFQQSSRQSAANETAANAAKAAVEQYKRGNDFAEKNFKSSDSTNRAFLDKATRSSDALAKADSTAEKNYKLARFRLHFLHAYPVILHWVFVFRGLLVIKF